MCNFENNRKLSRFEEEGLKSFKKLENDYFGEKGTESRKKYDEFVNKQIELKKVSVEKLDEEKETEELLKIFKSELKCGFFKIQESMKCETVASLLKINIGIEILECLKVFSKGARINFEEVAKEILGAEYDDTLKVAAINMIQFGVKQLSKQ